MTQQAAIAAVADAIVALDANDHDRCRRALGRAFIALMPKLATIQQVQEQEKKEATA